MENIDIIQLFKEFGWYQGLGFCLVFLIYDLIKRYFREKIKQGSITKENELGLERDDINFKKGSFGNLQSQYADLMLREKVESVKRMYDYVEILSGQTLFLRMMCHYEWKSIIKLNDKSELLKIKKLMDHLIDVLKVEENIEKVKNVQYKKGALFLNDKVVSYVKICEAVFLHAYMTITAVSLGTTELLKENRDLVQKIEDADPCSKSEFDKHGEYYMYYLFDYFIEQSRIQLRDEIGVAKVTSANASLIKSVVEMVKMQKM